MPTEQKPLVSVICICFNHERFVEASIASVLHQDYPEIELIVVDNGSKDESANVIAQMAQKYGLETMLHDQNLGHNKAFNLAFSQSRGSFIVDLAADDVLHPQRIARQVDFFLDRDQKTGVIYHRALCIDEEGKALQEWKKGKPFFGQSGDLFGPLMMRTFVPTPTMMIRRQVLEALEGYDESLSFEDFDFWVRSSRSFHYAFQDECLTYWRQVEGSHSRVQLGQGRRRMLQDVLKVLSWAKNHLKNKEEERAFRKGCLYYIRQSILNGDWDYAKSYLKLCIL